MSEGVIHAWLVAWVFVVFADDTTLRCLCGGALIVAALTALLRKA